MKIKPLPRSATRCGSFVEKLIEEMATFDEEIGKSRC